MNMNIVDKWKCEKKSGSAPSAEPDCGINGTLKLDCVTRTLI